MYDKAKDNRVAIGCLGLVVIIVLTNSKSFAEGDGAEIPSGYIASALTGNMLTASGIILISIGATLSFGYANSESHNCDADDCEELKCRDHYGCLSGVSFTNVGTGLFLTGIPLMFTAQLHVWKQSIRIPDFRRKYFQRLSITSWYFYGMTLVATIARYASGIAYRDVFMGMLVIMPLAIVSAGLMSHSLRMANKYYREELKDTAKDEIAIIPYVATVERGAIAGMILQY